MLDFRKQFQEIIEQSYIPFNIYTIAGYSLVA